MLEEISTYVGDRACFTIAASNGTAACPPHVTIEKLPTAFSMMAAHSLVTLGQVSPNAKVLLLDNGGYSMIRQTQDQWLDGEYHASFGAGGLTFPAFEHFAVANGFEYIPVHEQDQIGTDWRPCSQRPCRPWCT